MSGLIAGLALLTCSIQKEDTFFAVLWSRLRDELITVDARPSDAIALALRADCPIYVSEHVMQSAKLNMSGPPEGPTAEELRGWLEGLNDEDLGHYKMYSISALCPTEVQPTAKCSDSRSALGISH